MHGYLDDESRILHEWYDLFRQNNQVPSNQELIYWKHIMQFGLKKFQKDLHNSYLIEKFLKNHFTVNKKLERNISKYQKLILPIDSYRLVFMNGKFLPSYSDSIINPWLLHFDKNSNRYKISQTIQQNLFLHLIEYLSNSIIKIKLPEHTTTKKPLYLLHMHSGSKIVNQLITSHYYYDINLGKNTNSCIIEHFVSIDGGGHFNGSLMNISINEQSILDHIKLISENQHSYHISNHDFNIKTHSHVNTTVFIVPGPQFVHHQINSKINHIQSFLSANSLSVLLNDNVCNIQTYLEHNNTDHAISKQLHKIIAKDHSTGVFKGLIKVNQKSINTDAKMINNNLLLNQLASIYSIPTLEIYSDAVQCGHGSTVGQIDKNCLFYLNTRGIPSEDALIMLIYAFTEEITKKIKNPVLRDCIINKINYALVGRTKNYEDIPYRKN